MFCIPLGEQRHDLTDTQTSSDCVRVVTAVSYHTIRTMAWTPICSLQRWDDIN